MVSWGHFQEKWFHFKGQSQAVSNEIDFSSCSFCRKLAILTSSDVYECCEKMADERQNKIPDSANIIRQVGFSATSQTHQFGLNQFTGTSVFFCLTQFQKISLTLCCIIKQYISQKAYNDSMTKESFNNVRCCQIKEMHCKSTEEMIFGQSMRNRNSDFQHPDGAQQLTLAVELRDASEVIFFLLS